MYVGWRVLVDVVSILMACLSFFPSFDLCFCRTGLWLLSVFVAHVVAGDFRRVWLIGLLFSALVRMSLF